MSVRLEIAPELAYPTPALEVIVGIFALLERDDLGKVAKQQRKSPPGSHYTDSHIMLVEDKHITALGSIKSGGAILQLFAKLEPKAIRE